MKESTSATSRSWSRAFREKGYNDPYLSGAGWLPDGFDQQQALDALDRGFPRSGLSRPV
jgi:hypothetical protein